MRAPPCARAASAASSSSSSERLDDDSRREKPRQIVGRAAHVGDVQVGRLLETDVDERGLHPGQHALDAALVDVSRDPTLAFPLDVELAKKSVFDERNPGFGAVGVDDQEAIRHARL